MFHQFPAKDREILFDNVNWGFQNITWQREKEIPGYQQLKQRLLTLKENIK